MPRSSPTPTPRWGVRLLIGALTVLVGFSVWRCATDPGPPPAVWVRANPAHPTGWAQSAVADAAGTVYDRVQVMVVMPHNDSADVTLCVSTPRLWWRHGRMIAGREPTERYRGPVAASRVVRPDGEWYRFDLVTD